MSGTNSIFVFMASDNDLEEAAEKGIENLYMASLSEGINVVVQHDPGRTGYFDRNDKPTTRFAIHNHQRKDEAEMGETNCGDPRVLREFLKWGMSTYPAKRTIAVISSHGTGAKDNDVFRSFSEEIGSWWSSFWKKGTATPRIQSPGNPETDHNCSGLPKVMPISSTRLSSVRAKNLIQNDTGSGDKRKEYYAICPDMAIFRFRNSGRRSPIPISSCPDDRLPHDARIEATGIAPDNVTKGISPDAHIPSSQTHDYLTNVELGQALDIPSKKIDILILDACLMNTFEVLYEVRERADMVIGSEDTIPEEGLPFVSFLNFLSLHPEADNETMASALADAYKTNEVFLKGPKRLLTLSAIRTERLEDAAVALDRFAESLLKSLVSIREPMRNIFTNVQKFGEIWQRYDSDKEYIDLYHFTSLCKARLNQDTIQESARDLLARLDETVSCNIAVATGSSKPVENSHARGLSIYFPPSPPNDEILDLYKQLQFNSRCSHWLTLVTAFHAG